jgi:hypothetical protein
MNFGWAAGKGSGREGPTILTLTDNKASFAIAV